LLLHEERHRLNLFAPAVAPHVTIVPRAPGTRNTST
jgi:hypothetical protein